MSDKKESGDEKTTATGPAGGTETKVEPAKAQEPAKTAPTQTQAQPAGGQQAPDATKPADRVPTRKLLGDDDDIPDDADLIEMSPKKLKGRLERHTKKQLRDRFGTDDPDEIKGRLDKLAKFEEDQEKARLAQLSEIDRYREKLEASEKARLDAEARIVKQHQQRVVETEDRRATKILAEFVDEDDIEDVIPKLARHIDRTPVEQLGNPDEVIRAWAKDFVAKKPKFAKVKAEEQKAAPVKVPLSNGTQGGKPPNATDVGEKTAAPGRPNSMTDAEWKAEKRRLGLTY